MAHLFRRLTQVRTAKRRVEDVTMELTDDLQAFIREGGSNDTCEVVIELAGPRDRYEQRTLVRHGRRINRSVRVHTLTDAEQVELRAVKREAGSLLRSILRAPVRELSNYPGFVTEVTPQELAEIARKGDDVIRAVQPNASIALPDAAGPQSVRVD